MARYFREIATVREQITFYTVDATELSFLRNKRQRFVKTVLKTWDKILRSISYLSVSAMDKLFRI